MSYSKAMCVLHVNSPTTESLKEFDPISWLKVKEADEARRSRVKSSQFYKIKLPEHYDSQTCYHSSCYKDFTALSIKTKNYNIVKNKKNNQSRKVRTLRSDVEHQVCGSTGVFKHVCLFCGQVYKKHKHKREFLGKVGSPKSANQIKIAATKLQDSVVLAKISGQDLLAKELKLHHSCRSAYLKKAKRCIVSRDISIEKTAHSKAFEIVQLHVRQTLIENTGAEKLISLHKLYLESLGTNKSGFKSQNLCEKLFKTFPDALRTYKLSNKEGLIICHHSLSEEAAIKKVKFDVHSVKEVAVYLRYLILSSTVEELPETLTVGALAKGQGSIPKELSEFFRVLYTGSTDKPESEQVQRYVSSVCDDVMFATSRGKIKSDKHLCLGLGIKSISGSRRIIEILNRLGHSVNYHTIEELETQMASDIYCRNRALPDGMKTTAGLGTSLAWDNYDENVETLSGSGTLHDTVGICYQNVLQDTESHEVIESSTPTKEQTPPKSKRTLEFQDKSLEPYRKKPKMSQFDYQIVRETKPDKFSKIEKRDLFWMMNVALQEQTPMWTGWNSLVTEDVLPKHTIGYMENLTLPPTRLDVVAETLKQSQRVANECGDEYVVVTYDLAVAKLAMQIQATECPKYNNVFICFGAFHIMLAYFGALGYLLDSSGGPEILTESEVLAAGSLNGFLTGKHYNRCYRLHQMLAAAFQILHFRSFLEKFGALPSTFEDYMGQMREGPSSNLLTEIESSVDYINFMAQYRNHIEETLLGNHGSTAKFWMTYIKLVNILYRFSRASRTNDLELFIFTLGEMCAVFFAANRPNYSRWMVKYHLNLLNVENTHPGVKHILESGALSVRRTNKKFSRTAVDLTLEQTINADAASRLTGIASYSCSDSARRRWMLTRYARSGIVGSLLEKAGLKSEEDVSKTLKNYRAKKDNEDLNQMIGKIESMMNPFTLEADENLYCITTGKQVSDPTRADLLDVLEKGAEWCEEFRSECFADPLRFEKPIRRRKVKNFASEAIKSKVTSKDEKLVELQGTRDLFGRLLYISTVQNIDLSKVFKYPLLPVPPSLAHVDGTMNKTDKSKLMKKLEVLCTGSTATSVDATLVDAVFLLHTLQNVPTTFGGISRMILEQICGLSQRVDFICDAYKTPSIKDVERKRRGSHDVAYVVTGPDQKRPKEWQHALQSSSFKTALFKFLVSNWMSQCYADVMKGHTIYLAVEEDCYKYYEQRGEVWQTRVPEYNCQHEEADTRLIYHMIKIAEEDASMKISIRSNDTDVLVLMLYHCGNMTTSPLLWMDAGLSSYNTRRYINVSYAQEEIEKQLSDALPGLHAFTGSDYTASFLNKGKQKPFDLLVKSKKSMKAFSQLGESITVPNEVKQDIETFVCTLYGYPNMTKVDDVRYTMFQQYYAPKKNSDPLKRLAGINPSCMPPCQQVLSEKIDRANYVAAVWKRACCPQPVQSQPEDNGWLLENNTYSINWYEGDQLPQSIVEILLTEALNETANEEDSDGGNGYSSDSDDD